MTEPESFTACARCEKNPAPQPVKVWATAPDIAQEGDETVINETVRLCTPCRIKADRENAAASNRSRGSHT